MNDNEISFIIEPDCSYRFKGAFGESLSLGTDAKGIAKYLRSVAQFLDHWSEIEEEETDESES